MQIEIRYRAGEGENWPCVAWTEIRGQPYTAIGKTWEEARDNLLETVKKFLTTEIPASETVHLGDDGEELFLADDVVTKEEVPS
jgi:hypothetical protein